MTSRVLQWTQRSHWRGRSSAVGLPLAIGAASWCILQQSIGVSSPTTLDDQTTPSEDAPFSYQIDVSFIDKLASKAYLHFSDHDTAQKTRPFGVPETLRILTVDLPEVRRGFSNGQCSVDTSRIYPDGIASPETIEVKKGRGMISVEVEQKAWVKSMVKCIATGSPDKVSVEIMEADVGRMNPSNIRRIHQYGTLRYDPGKYTVTSPRTDRRRTKRQSLRDDEETRILNEIQAPWHQQSWREEEIGRAHV